MKFWLLGFLFLCFFSLRTFATKTTNETEQILLTYEQFSNLTNAEQKTYVKKLREIMVEMSAAFPEFANERSARSSFFVQMWNLNFQAAFGEGADTPSIADIEAFVKYANREAASYLKAVSEAKPATEKAVLVEQYRQALYWSANAAVQAHNIPDKKKREQVLKDSVNPTKKLVENAEARVKQFASEADYSEARDQYFKKAHRGELLPGDPFPSSAFVPSGDRLPPSPVAKAEEKKADKIAPKPVDKLAAAEKTTGVVKSNTSNDSYYRCMNAGFVIKKGPDCLAPSELPWDLSGLDRKTFICEKGTIMCNPFVFGFKSSCDWIVAIEKNRTDTCMKAATPYCVNAGLYATKNCRSISNSDSALQAAVQLINENGATFNQFGDSFSDLCNKGLIDFNSYKRKRTSANIQATKNDIKRTCDSARVRMDEIKNRFQVLSVPAGKKDGPVPAPEKAGKK
jgi:hypothetical protein